MSVLLLADIANDKLSIDATAKAVAAVQSLGEITILVCASSTAGEKAAQEAGKITGVSNVLLAQGDHLANGLAENVTETILSNADGFDFIVAAATNYGKNILPRVAALLDVMVISDVMEIVSLDTFKRPIYAGNGVQTVQSADKVKVMSIRTASFDSAQLSGTAGVEAAQTSQDSGLSKHIADIVEEAERPELTSAKIVVSGGRALSSKEQFSIIEELADKLGAAVGASRAAVDAGYAPNDWQVGQTGKIVAPDLYMAVGISGAIQHIAGMKDAGIIVAINKDEDAPIFQVADYGLVADLFEAVPELISKL